METIETCFHQMFELQAELQPQRPAVIYNDRQLSYSELNAQANRLAHYLRSLGAGPETLIPICVERSVEMAVGILGILKAGAAYVPIDPDYPQERIEFMLADTAAQLVVTQSHLTSQLTRSGARLVLMDFDWQSIRQQSPVNPLLNVTPDNLAYVIYTSGSTGQPKGTMLTHANLSHYVSGLQDELQLSPSDRYLHLASIAFSSSRRHLMLPLSQGATVVIANQDQRLDALALLRLIRKEGVSVFDAVPSLQRHCTNFLRELNAEQRAWLLDNQVRLIVSASEPLLSDVPRIWKKEFNHPAHHVHMFGQTETSGIVTLRHITDEDCEQIKVVPVGRPIARTQIFLLDEQQQPVADGEPGEIYIHSAGLGRGYLQRPELTAEKFVSGQWSVVSGQWSVDSKLSHQPPTADNKSTDNGQLTTDAVRLCRTGDFARRLPDGTFECLGRQDHQVKIRGFRVELGELEALFARHPEVRESSVIAREDQRGNKRLVAYIVARQPQSDIISELRTLAQQQLPDYMRPAAYVLLDHLPLTPNGKVHRLALPEPDESAFATGQEYVAPRTETEKLIADIWADVLQLKQPSIHDHFFELGGHSLLAGQVVSRLRTVFRLEIPLRVLFAAPTIAALAERIESLQNNAEPSLPRLVHRARKDTIPLSFAQRRLWFLDQLEPGSATYNLSKVVRIAGELNVAALQAALQTLVARHEILRTNFVSLEGQPVQRIAAARQIELQLFDLSASPASSQAIEVERLAFEFTQRPFALASELLLRAQLLSLSATEHQLTIVFHHIISDGWSIGVFFRELDACYQAHRNGQSPALPALPLQYADYAEWQHEVLQGETLAEQLTFWQEHLAGAPSLLELPTDRPRPAAQRYGGSQISLRLPAALSREVKALSQREGVTLFMTLLAAFQTLLARYSGQDQIVVGTPIAGRTHTETESLIGFFVNTLALRGDLSGDPSFRELLSRTRERALGAYAHQDLPFEKLVEELQPERSLSFSPVFQVMFALQNAPTVDAAQTELKFQTVRLPHNSAKFDLSLDVYELGDELDLRLEFDTDLFDAETAESLLQHYQTLLAAVANDPAINIAAAPLLTAQEQQQLFVEWNQRQTEVPAVCLHQLIEAQAAARPEAIAVVWENERLTYGDLNARANQLARYLQQAGVGPEVIVGLCVERSLAMIVGLLGVLKAGGAYLPLDPNYPTERLQHMLTDARASVLLTQKALLSKVQRSDAGEATTKVICLDADGARIMEQSQAPVSSEVTPDNMAYVIFTSGSTGKSKGVMVTHGSVVNAYAAWEADYQLSSLQAHLQMASFSFDVFTGDLTRALCSGARLVLCPTELLLESEDLYQLMQQEGVDAAEFVPAVIRPLMDYLQRTAQRLDFMRLLVVGSDVWQMDEYQQLRRLCGEQTRVISSYGVTEATIDSTYFEATEADENREGIVPIGRQFANTHIFLLDRNQQPVPIGVPGELYIGGAGVARGYLNRPELTAEKFVHCPWSVVSGQLPLDSKPGHQLPTADNKSTDYGQGTTDAARLYRTGDVGRYRRDGILELMGRADQQVKLRGYRIELGEIEAALLRHPAVKECAVIVREDQPGDKRLAAYLVAHSESVETAALRRVLKEHLPEYMVPSAFVWMELLPLTPNGKVDRRALPAPQENRVEAASSYVAPRTPREEKLAQIMAELLKLERVGLHDNFFELGGHSLLATQVVSRIRDSFRVEMPLRIIFSAPTVAGLANWISSSLSGETSDITARQTAMTDDHAYPQSFAQQRLWFLDQFDPDNSVYNLPSVMRVQGPLDMDALELGVNEIIARHAILRTNFTLQQDEPIQTIAPSAKVTIQLTDLTDSSEGEREAEALRLAGEEVRRPFDLCREPLLRVRLIRLHATDHLLVTVFHHIVSDGWSLGVFYKELGALYKASVSGAEAALPELTIQYADYAEWQQQQLQGAVLAEQLAFWKQHLAGAPTVLNLPADYPRPSVQRNCGAQLFAQLSAELLASLNELSRREGVTLFMTLLAAFQTLLARYSGQDQIVVGTPIAGRTHTETESLIGFFVNTLALRGDLSGDPSFRALLARTRERALGAYAHQDMPFEKLVEELQPERTLKYSPIFQVMFALQNTPVAELRWQELTLNPVKLPSQTAKFDLSLDAVEEKDGLHLWLEYDTALFAAPSIEQLMQQFCVLLTSLVQNPDQHLNELPLLLPTIQTTVSQDAGSLQSQPEKAAGYVAPRNVTEEIVAEVFAVVLGQPQVSVTEDFFDLGGHSLLAAKVITRLRSRFDIKLPLRNIFEAPTVASLSAMIDEMLAEQTDDPELAALLAELEGMSDEEAQQLLARDSAGQNNWAE